MLIVVNYHRVDDVDGLSIDDFKNSISWLAKKFDVIYPYDLQNINVSDSNYAIITFDDGLKCQYVIANEILKSLNIPFSVFFIGESLFERKVPKVHSLQVIFKNIPIKEIESHIFFNKKISEKKIRCHYRYDEFNVAKLKYIINYLLKERDVENFISNMSKKILCSGRNLCEDIFMNQKEMMEISKFCHIGSHAWTHKPLAQLDNNAIQIELTRTKQYLEKILCKNIETISYPLGNDMAVNQRVFKFALKSGYRYGFTMKREANYIIDNFISMNRIDCNDLPEVGKKPLFNSNFNIL